LRISSEELHRPGRTAAALLASLPAAIVAIVATIATILASTTAAVAGELSARITDAGNKPVADAVVLATSIDRRPALKPAREIVDQIDHQFVPYVKVIVVGSSVFFPNKDNVRHQVYSFSPAKKFELPLYAGTPSVPVDFDKPGVVVLGCNIHDWMIGYIYVADTPYFGKSGPDGMVSIDNLPAGDYQVRVWHPQLAAREDTTIRRVSIGSGRTQESWQLELKPESRPRRAPIGGAHGYH
jgi:plastocyanin